MFGEKKESFEIETIIGPSVSLRGKLKGDNSIKVQGKISGEIRTKGDVFVDEGAQIKATVSARNIVISGEIQGDVEATEELEITEKGKVVGNITATTLVIRMGAIFIGKSTMKDEALKESKKIKESEPEPEPELDS